MPRSRSRSAHPIDHLLDPTSVSRIADVTADFEVGLMIYNAGASTCNEPFLEADLSDFQRVTDLNVTRMLELVNTTGGRWLRGAAAAS